MCSVKTHEREKPAGSEADVFLDAVLYCVYYLSGRTVGTEHLHVVLHIKTTHF